MCTWRENHDRADMILSSEEGGHMGQNAAIGKCVSPKSVYGI